jgi:hydrogenase expression/formation protein HypD
MKYLDEYRDAAAVHGYADAIQAITTQPHVLMEICGGQTHTIVKYGIDSLLPSQVTLVHGPGCPVCVTPLELIDRALHIAHIPNVIFCSFGDMLRVPGSDEDLLSAKAAGADVRIVYSPLDAVQIARENPAKQVAFFAVGFETTAPANAMAVFQAHQESVENFSILCSHVLVPPAMEAILSASGNRVTGFLAAGHVCAVMGYEEYEPLARKYQVPIVVTGFEPLDLLHGVYLCIKQLEEGRTEVENQYTRSVTRDGNRAAQDLVRTVFEVSPRKWRGMGNIPRSGLGLRTPYTEYDAERRFDVGDIQADEPETCISGQVLQGRKAPGECPAFGTVCTPDHPLGAPMVSSEGACAAYYRYRRSGLMEPASIGEHP